KTFKIPTVFHLHGKGMSTGKAANLRRNCYRWTFKKSLVIQLSPRLYGELETIIPREQCRVVPNGVPDPFEGEQVPVRETSKSAEVLFLSNMVREKGI